MRDGARQCCTRLLHAPRNRGVALITTIVAAPNRVGPLGAFAILALALVLGADAALASSDTTFQGPLTTVTNIVGGTGGQLAATLAVGAALVGSVMRFNTQQLLGAVGVGIAAGAGVGVVTGLVGTAIV